MRACFGGGGRSRFLRHRRRGLRCRLIGGGVGEGVHWNCVAVVVERAKEVESRRREVNDIGVFMTGE